MAKKSGEKNNKRMKKAVGKVIKYLDDLEFVDSCERLNAKGPSSRGSYKFPYVEYTGDLSSGIKAKVHVGCGYQAIRVSLKNGKSDMVENQRALIRIFHYNYQQTSKNPAYKPPPLEEIIGYGKISNHSKKQ